VENKELLQEITIPLYIREYIKSKNIRPKYYRRDKVKNIPNKYIKNKELYSWMTFLVSNKTGYNTVKEFLVEKASGKRIVANEHRVGKANMKNINGQAIYNGQIQEHDRNNMIGQIKDSFRKEIQSLEVIKRFPVEIKVYLFDTVIDEDFSNGQDWDVDNRFFPYGKSFADELKKQNKIPDDNRYYITTPPYATFCPVPDVEDRKLVVRIYKDNRPIILNNYLYQKKHGEQLK
jgi:hypothetical protein